MNKHEPSNKSRRSSSESSTTSAGLRAAKLISDLREKLGPDPFWSSYFRTRIVAARSDWALHVAVFQEPFLTYVLDGRKGVESRFSENRVAPFGEVVAGDIVVLKKVGGAVVGICLVTACWSYRLDARSWTTIRERFEPLLCVNEEFWSTRNDARFATLIALGEVRTLSPIDYEKNDRRGWVVERPRIAQESMDI